MPGKRECGRSVVVYLPDEMFFEIEKMRRAKRISRSRFVQICIAKGLRSVSEEEIRRARRIWSWNEAKEVLSHEK